jgi:hypothetical protein
MEGGVLFCYTGGFLGIATWVVASEAFGGYVSIQFAGFVCHHGAETNNKSVLLTDNPSLYGAEHRRLIEPRGSGTADSHSGGEAEGW